MLISIDDVEIGDRSRKEFGDLNGLALSIHEYGQLQPVVVEKKSDGKYLLIAGERRIQALRILKATEVAAVLKEELSPLERVEIELEENIRRKDFSWQEEVALKLKIDQIKRTKYGEKEGRARGNQFAKSGWTLKDTAEELGISRTTLGADLELARAMERHPELAKEKNKHSAFKKFKVLEEQRIREEIARRQKNKGSLADLEKSVYRGDCVQILKELPSNSVQLVVTDPPYGIDIDDLLDADNSSGLPVFDDNRSSALDDMDLAIKELARVMTLHSSMYIFFGLTMYYDMTRLLTKHRFKYDPMPLIWYKQNIGGGRVTHPGIHHCRTYETILYAYRGSRELVKQGQANVLCYDVVPANRKIHPTEKPLPLLRDLIERASFEGETVLDPFAGSGSTLLAASQIGRQFIGIEKDEARYNAICQRIIRPAVAKAIDEVGDLLSGGADA